LSLHYSPKLSWHLIILPRCYALAMTFLSESKNQAYSTNFIHLYWLIKYLNSKLISRDY
jgi:hypothetical protein